MPVAATRLGDLIPGRIDHTIDGPTARQDRRTIRVHRRGDIITAATFLTPATSVPESPAHGDLPKKAPFGAATRNPTGCGQS